ncbi:Na/Pi symporter [Cognataquiflexum aquatile]|uniref:Na/Pi symporter n=1 Tax=Cognataquiflexum aquatile TaxID=2249427 RepID=UPI000DEB1CC8|nr:Na/Pi symporter [Cognataquiflexum aquatile]
MTELKEASQKSSKGLIIFQMLLAFVLFMFSIDLLTVAMVRMNNILAEDLFQATNNPFVGLFVGLLITALVQSSSMVTSMIVAVVASGNLTLMQAVPLVMGANIGTTLTSTLVAFSYIMKKGEFKRALTAGVVHDIFNILTVMILFPLEIYFGFLSRTASFLTNAFFDFNSEFVGDYSYNVLFTRNLTTWLLDILNSPVIGLILSIILLFLSIKFLSDTVFRTFVSTNFEKISRQMFKFPFMSFMYGLFFTAAIQSSTVTTSLIVPAVANRKVSLSKVFPFIIGANVGTTITAVIASIYKTEAAISIALVHVLFNLIGALVFLPFPALRNIPVKLATFLGDQSVKRKFVGFAYILLTFFIIPFILIYFNKDNHGVEKEQNPKVKPKIEIQADKPM